ncbi:MAG TPA: hypothetical protein VGM17_12930 [Rhizomicrobium sp.]|jgi:hypothetical protein
MPKAKLVWKKKPEADDLAAAQHYLSLICPAATCKKLVQAMEYADTGEYAAKDLLRASHLPLLPREEPHVDDDLKKIHKGKPLAPVLLVRGDYKSDIPVVVADGYHRICAVYYFDENAPILCRMAG